MTQHFKEYPTQEKVRELFDYSETPYALNGRELIGGLVWRLKRDSLGRPNTQWHGKFAGNVRNSDARVAVNIRGSNYELNRLIWIWHNGDIPPGQLVDHADRLPADSRIGNLRLATHSENNCNREKGEGCSSKHKGVYWDADNRKWCAQIKKNYKVTHLGSFGSEQEAADARNVAARSAHGEFAVLNV